MAQYQSFPDASGASRTLDKVKALALPQLEGRSFLDVGCNEGFFCGFAKFLGASRSVGLDKSALFLERARRRFPDCEFLLQDWDTLPEGRFDVILLASALHYADDQAALIARLVDALSDDGTLVLEMGIAPAGGSDWVEVDRGIDRRAFPTMAKLREILDGYAWKWMGRSVSQSGDPVPRHVVHVSRRRPIAYLLLQPPAFGKSSIASRLFPPAGVPVVSGDRLLSAAAQGEAEVAPGLRDILASDYSPFRIDAVINRAFDEGHGQGLVALWASEVAGGDFALDVFVPADHHRAVEDGLRARGYLPVSLRWDRVGPALLSAASVAEQAERFYGALAAHGNAETEAVRSSRSNDLGYVDEIGFQDGVLWVRGWAVDATGELPAGIAVRCNGVDLVPENVQRQERPDVRRHLRLSHGWVGYLLSVPIPGVDSVERIPADFMVFVPAAGRMRFNGRVQRLLSRRAAG